MMNILSRWDNPIFRRELIRLARREAPHRWRSFFVFVGLVSILVLLFIVLLWMYPTTYGQQFIWMFFPAWASWVVYAITVLQTLLAGIGILSTEYTTRTWEPLILTGISARQLLVGTWLASMHRVRGWLFFLVIARIVVLPVYLVVSARVAPMECVGSGCLWHFFPSADVWVAAIGITVVITIVDMLCCALIGLASSLIVRHAGAAAALAIFLRFLPLIIFLAVGYDDANFWAWWSAPWFALVDGGTAPAIQLIMPLLPRWVQFEPRLGLALVVGALAILLLIAIKVNVVLLRRVGASVQSRSIDTAKRYSVAGVNQMGNID